MGVENYQFSLEAQPISKLMGNNIFYLVAVTKPGNGLDTPCHAKLF